MDSEAQARLARIRRLQRIKERQRDVAHADLALAQRRRDEAHVRRSSIEQQWTEEASVSSTATTKDVTDFAREREHLREVEGHADAAADACREADSLRDEKRTEAQHAHRQYRQLELWSEAEEKRQAREGVRRERIYLDEIAAHLRERGK
ncbi:MAG: hypothetical protein AAGA56_31440 [Myxococcota bacterium]